MRRYLGAILAIWGLAALSVSAEDYWVKKDWTSWSQEDCKKMLRDSPWTIRWIDTVGEEAAHTPADTSISQELRSDNRSQETQVYYYVQDRSSIPVREAAVRQLQIARKYDKMGDAEKKSLDARGEAFLNRTYDDVIVIDVEYGSNGRVVGNQLVNYWKSTREDAIRANVFLINARGEHIPPVRFVSPKNGDYSFQLFFPRENRGEPVIAADDKTFSIEFHSPALDIAPLGVSGSNPATSTPTKMGGRLVLAEFNLKKMMWKGRPSF